MGKRDSPKTRRVSSSSRPLEGTASDQAGFFVGHRVASRSSRSVHSAQPEAVTGSVGAEPFEQPVVFAARGEDVAVLAGHLEDDAGVVVEARGEARVKHDVGLGRKRNSAAACERTVSSGVLDVDAGGAGHLPDAVERALRRVDDGEIVDQQLPPNSSGIG